MIKLLLSVSCRQARLRELGKDLKKITRRELEVADRVFDLVYLPPRTLKGAERLEKLSRFWYQLRSKRKWIARKIWWLRLITSPPRSCQIIG